jgi:hypothetical protein
LPFQSALVVVFVVIFVIVVFVVVIVVAVVVAASTDLVDMHCPLLAKSSSSDDSNVLDIESCFDMDDEERETNSSTNLMDINTNVEG